MRLLKIIENKNRALVILLIFHFLYRIILLSIKAFPFNSDEAIVGLMAKHILEGENFLYFYGQSYMGSLDAYLVALGFLVFGQSVLVIRIVQIFLYGLTILFIFLFVNNAFKNLTLAFLSTLFLVFPPVNVVLYTTVSLGGYGEALLLGAMSFYLAEKIISGKLKQKTEYLIISLLGLIFGVGLFVNPLSLTIIIPAIIYLIYKLLNSNKRTKWKAFLPIFFIFLIIGSIPFWYSLFFTNGFSVIEEIRGSAIAVEETTFFNKTISHITSFLLFGPSVILGLRAPWSVEWIGQYFIPVIIFFWILMVFLFFSKNNKKIKMDTVFFMFLIVILVVGGFVFSSFGVDPSGRYFLPIIFPLGLIFGYGMCYFGNKIVHILALLVIMFQIYGSVTSAIKKPYITTQFYSPAQVNHSEMKSLINFLTEKNELNGYTNYWVAYPLAFLSNERIIAIPELPYHPDLRYTARDNRIEKYDKIVEQSDTRFFITTNNIPLDHLIIEKLSEQQIIFESKKIGDYQIYFNLSKKISPLELGLLNEFK